MSSDEDGGTPGMGFSRGKQDAWIGEDSDDESSFGGGGRGGGGKGGRGGGRGGKKKKGGGKNANSNANDGVPISFVSASAEVTAPFARPPPPPPPAPPPPKAEETEEVGNDAFRERMLSEMAAAAAEKEKAVAASAAAAEAKKALRPDVKSTKPEWERHTKGVGYALLQKMGFKGRLGKDESGVSTNVEVQVRPNAMGLGFKKGGFKEESQLDGNRKLQRELGQTIHETPEAAAREVFEKQEVTKARERRRRIFANANSMAAELNALPQQNKQQQPVMSEETRMKGEAAAAEPAELRLARRLLEDVEASLNAEEAALADASRRERAEIGREDALRSDLDRAKQKAPALRGHADRLRNFATALRKLTGAVEVTAEAMLTGVQKVRAAFKEEWALAGASRLLPAMIIPLARRALGDDWDALKEPTRGKAVVETWKPGRFCASLDDDYDEFFEVEVMPKCRNALARDWDVGDPDRDKKKDRNALKLAEWLCTVNERSARMVSGIVEPRLRQALKSREKQRRERRVHTAEEISARLERLSWVAEWLGSSHIQIGEVVFEAAEKMLKDELRNLVLAPCSRRAAKELGRWKSALSSAGWKRLVGTKLPQAVSAAFGGGWSVDPSREGGQDWAPVDSLRVLVVGLGGPDEAAAALVTGELMPRWIRALHAWLQNSAADLDELGSWYLDWRARLLEGEMPSFGPRALAATESGLTLGLQLINVAILDRSTFTQTPLPAAASKTRNSYALALAANRTPTVHAPQRHNDTWAASVDAQGSIVFLDVVQTFATKSNVTFVPKPGREHDGKQIYSFNRATIYIANDVTYLRDTSTGVYGIASLEKVLAISRGQIWNDF